MKKITFKELVELDGKSIDEIHSFEEPTEKEKGIININGTTVFNCFKNKVVTDSDKNTFAIIQFYNKKNNIVANLSIFNVEDEGLIIESADRIYSETSLRVMNMNYK